MKRKNISVSEYIDLRSKQLSERVTGSTGITIEGLVLRKFGCRAERFKKSKDDLTSALCFHFNLVIPYKYQVWSVVMMMAVHSTGMHLPNGEEFKSGVHFFVKTLSGQYQKLRDFRVFLDMPGGERGTNIESWIEYWIQRCLKDSSVKRIFACKKLIAENQEEEISYMSTI